MAQTLLLGLGGTGSRIVNFVAKELKGRNISINDGQICCTVLDTNENDRKKIAATGVGVPVVATSKDRQIRDYLNMYANKGVRDWMPESPGLLKESMIDGAGQMRPKSRLAFMDILEDGTIHQLERHIDKLFDNRDGSKIRVMVVSSLAGGTGSGMFIQTALWLRKYFNKRKCSITIRGIFVLPDVFIRTIKDIADDPTEQQSLYANAYGAIRELNAITKIKTKGMSPLLPVKIDNLFDSEVGQPDGQPVFDYAFFVDDIAEGGSALNQIDHYEQVVARLVYMQLYAPMHDDLYSEEDNLFKRFQKSPEPVFGSCGTAKAMYPVDSVRDYCALRAAQEALSTGWKSIDKEIEVKKKKEEERELNGVVVSRRISPRHEYVRLFDAKTSRSGVQVGNNRLFYSIANDVKNEKLVPGADGVAEVSLSDKVEDFLAELDTIIATTVDTEDPGNLKGIRVKKSWAEQTTDSRESLILFVEKKEREIKRFLEETDGAVDAMAEQILDAVFSADMGDVNQDNPASIFGMMTKQDKNKKTYFIHPIAVRYLLYKMATALDGVKTSVAIDALRQSAEKGHGQGKKKVDFDNKRTGATEDGPIGYLKSKALFQNEEKFLANFKSLYAQHNEGQFELCRKYAIASLKLRLAALLSERLENLTVVVEDFFKNLNKVSNSLEDAVGANVRETEETAQKVIYVCATGEEKEALFKSLQFSTDSIDVNVSRIVFRALYGQFCASENKSAENNKPYSGQSVENTFYNEILATYGMLMRTKYKNDVEMDIYTALCKSTDFAYEKQQAAIEEKKDEDDRLNIDKETGLAGNPENRRQRYVEAMYSLVDKLLDLGAPSLISNDEFPEDVSDEFISDGYEEDEEIAFMPIRKRKTFWGFHPVLARKCEELAGILGVNIQSQQNEAYAKNELECYRAIYGIQAGYVEKFNELANGDYYKSYRQVVREMIVGVGEGRMDELVHTPHLDKTWHLFLPYITPEKQLLEDNKFYRAFWLALAYGLVSLGANGKYQIARTKKTATGQYQKNEPILLDGETVGKVDVLKLLAALKLDGSFMLNAPALDKRFAEECEKLDNYEGTEFLRGKVVKETKGKAEGETVKATVGGLASKHDNNAVTMIIRYHNSPRHDDDTTAMLIQSLESLCRELVANNYERSEVSKIEHKGYELCKRIYIASTLKDKDIELIQHWKEAWAKPVSND